jgi:hypothetical protein
MLSAGDKVTSYVAIRSDEDDREGYSAKHPNLTVSLPFREAGVDKKGVHDILESSGVGLPKYYHLAVAKRLHLLLLPAEDRVGPLEGAASRRVRTG